MTIKVFKSRFFETLEGQYSREEIGSFFNILTEHFLNMSRLDVAIHPQKEVSDDNMENFRESLQRLKQHEPIQYITGRTEFFGLDFQVDKNVLIPRPETEELVQWILEDFQDTKERELKILDIGTGSGCIAISLAKNLPRAKITAMDISEGAIELAKQNAVINGVEVDFLKEDILKVQELRGEFDVIVSNPPYVRELEKSTMRKNVLNFEPKMALYVADEDPFVFYEKISGLAANSLASGGAVYLEINQYLGGETEKLLAAKNFRTRLKKDIFGVNRMLRGKK